MSKLTAALRQAPATVPAFAALALFVVWATSQAGYPVTHWAPGGVIVLVLLVIALVTVPVRWREIPRTVRVALCCLAGYTALSFLSILWAGVPGDAWEGADRTLLYLLVFALFACWRQRGVTAASLLIAWTLALAALGAFVTFHIATAGAAQLQSLLPGGRLEYPSGYVNANAAQWLMAFWPALLLARSERLPWGLRGVLAASAVLLAEVALLSQSRGSLYSTPVMLVLVFVLLPGRTRTFALLVPIAAGVAAAAPAVLHVGDRLQDGLVSASTVHTAAAAMFSAALVVGVVVAAGAAIEGRLGERSSQRSSLAMRAFAASTLVAVVVGGLAVAGNPLTRAEHAWHSFKGGYASDSSTGSRLVSGLGSNRYDFYRVAVDEFLSHPLVGIGADNFQQQYLLHGRSNETPRYPHSIELRTLAETGLVGVALALVGLAAALTAGMRALRSVDPLAASAAAAALSAFAYWVVHGSFDWFFEFAGLGAPAFALLGLACALVPARTVAQGHVQARRPEQAQGHEQAPGRGQAPGREQAPGRVRRTRLLALAGGLVGLAAAGSLVAPWLSELEIESAARVWPAAPQVAFARLRDAARLNPLSDEAYVVAGNIALRYGELARADEQFAQALRRTPGDAYATLERGAIASTSGRRSAALRLLSRAVRLDPRDPLAREVLTLVQAGRRVSVTQLDRQIFLKARQLS